MIIKIKSKLFVSDCKNCLLIAYELLMNHLPVTYQFLYAAYK